MFNTVYFVMVMVMFLSSTCSASDCELSKTISGDALNKAKALLKRLDPLKGKAFTVIDEHGDVTYNYTAGICSSVSKDPLDAILQTYKQDDTKKKVVGRLNDTSVMGGATWIMLSYGSGDKYNGHCVNQSERHGNIMVICDRSASKPSFKIVEENNEQDRDCYYLFELTTCEICPEEEKHGLSSWSIFFVLLLCAVVMYFIVGILYKRIVLDKRGVEQLPNYKGWMFFGNKSADICDYLCRCRSEDESDYSAVSQSIPASLAEDDQLLNP